MDESKTSTDWTAAVKAVRAGDEDGIRIFAKSVGRMAWSFFRGRGVPPTKSEDLAETCATVVTLNLEKFDGQNFAAWAHTIFRNTLAGEYRNKPKLVEADDSTPWEKPLWDGNTPRLGRQARGAIATAVSQLDDRDQRIVAMRFGREPVEFKAIASEVGLSEGTARVRFKRALLRLDTLLRADPRMKERIARCDGSLVVVRKRK